jgi:tol-pal system protein YbgF
MKRILSICVLGALLTFSTPAWAVSKEIIELQQMVQNLSTQVLALQKAFLEKNQQMADLVEKSADNSNRLQTAIDNLQKTVQSSLGSQVTSTNQRMDSQQQRLQLINDSVDELKARQNKLSEQLTQIRMLLETIQAPAPAAAAPQQQAVPQGPPPPPAAPALYESALRDIATNPKQAMAEMMDYLKYYPDGERAENCQFYIGEINYMNGDFQRAVDAYHIAIDRYPDGNKTPSAHLKLGFALLELRQKDAAVKELRLVAKKYPRSDEAKKALERLKGLGLPVR